MTEWTAERLDALPEGTIIGVRHRHLDNHLPMVRLNDSWHACGGFGRWDSAQVVFGDPDIRVVSLPIAALLESADAVGDLWIWLASEVDDFRAQLNAAFAHVTGGQP